MIATLGDEVLLVHNRMRAAWELPGGFVDMGETPEVCARRELREESGQCVSDMTCLADIPIELPDGTSLRGRVSRTVLLQWTPFVTSTGTDACRTWPACALPTPLSAIDACLVQQSA